ncbi:hypothetical protein [Phenylobacterium sp.]|jgi:hypothetical protein|uniref:hypothetical protein n=1 Tax=Phenylobacterium sp. TaxID=1871053 RepID=UPI002F42C4EF
MPVKTPKRPHEDEAQSRRFIETAKALEADGDLSLTEGEKAFERLLERAIPPKEKGRSG